MTGSEHSHSNAGGHVLAAVDISDYATSVAHHAAWAAARLSAPLEFLHVLDRHPEVAPMADLSGSLDLGARSTLLAELARIDEDRSRLGQAHGRRLLQEMAGIAREAHGVEAVTTLRHGSLVDTLADLEDGVRLLVMGKRGAQADFASGHLGSQLERVVRAARRPLLVASHDFREIRRALIAFDGSDTAHRVVALVASSPLFAGLEIDVVTAGAGTGPERIALDGALEQLSAAGLAASGRILPGNPEDVIAHAVANGGVDLLVMGAYGHSRIRQLIVGSTTTALLRNCRVPVLLLR